MAFACACSLNINKKNKSLRGPRSKLPGPLCACACSLFKNKKKISVAKLQHTTGFIDGVCSGPGALLCVFLWVLDGVCSGPTWLLCVFACELGFFISLLR